MTTVVRRTAFGVLVIGRFPLALAAPELLARLHPDEAALARGWGERRQRTFAMGRLMAREALAAQGVDLAGPILPNDRGAPQLRAPFSLSLSHKDEVAAALLATETHAHVGVDVEPLTERERARDIASHVLTEQERAELSALEEDARRREVLVRFALKEALYKALDPYVRRYVGFLEVEARPQASGDEVRTAEMSTAEMHTAELVLGLPAQDGRFAARGGLLFIDELAVALARVERA